MKHKKLGQVYTPEWIVNEILDMLGYSGEPVLSRYIMEPACGDGAFLQAIVTRYIDAAKNKKLSNKAIKEGLEKYIYGIELDEDEYQKCIATLNSLCKEKIGEIEIDWKIESANTLEVYQNYRKKFDYIAGNPPYIRIHNLNSKTREIIKEQFTHSKGTIDIYVSFFEMGLHMLNPTGKLGYITPNSYLHNASYREFRRELRDKQLIDTLVDFKSEKVFKGFSTYTAITLLDLDNKRDYFSYKELKNNRIIEVNRINYKELELKSWVFTDRKNEQFLRSLTSGKKHRIDQFFSVQYGFATLRDAIYVDETEALKDSGELCLFQGVPMEKSILKTVVKASKFKGEIDPKLKIIFPYRKKGDRYEVIPEEVMKSEFPHCYKYFLENKAELKKRDIDKNALWYEYGRSQAVQSVHNEKIIISPMINGKLQFHKAGEDVMVYSGIFITKKSDAIEWEELSEVLASNDFYRYLRLTGKDLSGGYKSVNTKQIKSFLIK